MSPWRQAGLESIADQRARCQQGRHLLIFLTAVSVSSARVHCLHSGTIGMAAMLRGAGSAGGGHLPFGLVHPAGDSLFERREDHPAAPAFNRDHISQDVFGTPSETSCSAVLVEGRQGLVAVPEHGPTEVTRHIAGRPDKTLESLGT